jgi:phosphotransferase system HPr (HPr) family protein
MIEAQATIKNEMGIHCRPSAVILKKAADYPGDLRVIAPSGECALNSVMGLMALGLEQGTVVTIRVDGPDEEDTCRMLVELFETHFDFPPREDGSQRPLATGEQAGV